MTSQFAPEWLALREEADGAARAGALVAVLRDHLPPAPFAVRDLGCGTGSMGRWLAPLLPAGHRWILTDRDPVLLEHAAASLPVPAETDLRDITALTAADLAGTALVVASALLDLFTTEEIDGLAAACVEAGCPALFTLSVSGEVTLDPADPADRAVEAAFNAHQRRETGAGRLLGPDAGSYAAAAFERLGAQVRRAPSPWHLGPAERALTAEWLTGWVGAAAEQDPALPAEDYLRRRLAACAAGELRVVVGHEDLLALPPA